MTNNPIDPKNKINSNQELSEEQLEAVAGGTIPEIREAEGPKNKVKAVLDTAKDVKDAVKDALF